MAGRLSIDDFLGKEGGAKPPGLKVDEFLGPEEEAKPLTTSGFYGSHLAKLGGQSFSQGFIGAIVEAPRALSDLFDRHVGPLLGKGVPFPENGPGSWSNALLDKLGVNKAPIDIYGLNHPGPPTTEELQTYYAKHGLSGEEASGMGERLFAAGARGLGAAPEAILLGGANAPLLAAGAAAAGGVSGQSTAELGAPPWVQVASSMVPGLALGSWAGARQASTKAAAAQAEVEAAKSELSSSLTSENAALHGAPDSPLTAVKQAQASAQAKAAKAMGDFETSSEAAKTATIQASESELARRQALATQARQGVASTLGSSTTIQDAGQKLQEHARSWLSAVLPTKVSEAWSPLDSNLPDATPMELHGFTHALGEAGGRAGALQPVADLLGQGLPGKIAGRLRSLLEPPEEGASPPVTPTWGDVRRLRSILGEAMSDPKTVNDIGRQNLSAMYGGLTADMRVLAGQAGLSDEFEHAVDTSRKLYDLAEGPVSKIVSSKNASLSGDPPPEKVAQGLLSGGRLGDTTLSSLKSEGFPVGELASAKLRAEDSSKWWAGLSPEAKTTLIEDPRSAKLLDDSRDLEASSLARHKATVEAAEAVHELGLMETKAKLVLRPDALGARADSMSKANRLKVDAARQRLEAAQSALPPPKADDRFAELFKAAKYGLWGELATHALELLHAGLPPEVTGLGEGALVGALASKALPAAARSIKGALTRPGGMVAPVGAAAGAAANALGASRSPSL